MKFKPLNSKQIYNFSKEFLINRGYKSTNTISKKECSLCEDCNLGKSNLFETDWREYKS